MEFIADDPDLIAFINEGLDRLMRFLDCYRKFEDYLDRVGR